MPEMDGMAFREAISKDHPRLLDRFAYCTGSHLDDGISEYLALQRVKVLPKPATPADVRAFLAGVIQQT